MRLLKRLIEKASLLKVILSTIAFAIMYTVINYSPIGVAGLLKITDGAKILDFEFGYSIEKAYQMLTLLGNEGRYFYLTRILPLDFPFPMASMLFYFYLTSYLLKKIDGGKSLLNLVLLFPVLCMLFDWMENICIIVMLKQYPSISLAFCSFGSYMTILKSIFIYMKTIAIIILLITAIILFFKRRRTL